MSDWHMSDSRMPDWHQLRPLFKQYPRRFQPTAVRCVAGVGGLSGARLWQADTDGGAVCLRRWPREHPTEDRLRFIHDAMGFAGDQGFDRNLLPLAIVTVDGRSFLQHRGHLWQLETWLPGRACTASGVTTDVVARALATLAELHAALAQWPATLGRCQPPPAICSRLATLRTLHQEGCSELTAAADQLDAAPWTPPARQLARELNEAVGRVLPRVEEVSDGNLHCFPCLRDIHREHVLFTHHRVSGVVDWGAARVESPMADVARLLGSLAGDDRSLWEAGMQAYSLRRQLSADEERLVRVLDSSGVVLGAANWLRWLGVEQRAFPDPQAVADRLAELLARLTTLLGRHA